MRNSLGLTAEILPLFCSLFVRFVCLLFQKLFCYFCGNAAFVFGLRIFAFDKLKYSIAHYQISFLVLQIKLVLTYGELFVNIIHKYSLLFSLLYVHIYSVGH